MDEYEFTSDRLIAATTGGIAFEEPENFIQEIINWITEKSENVIDSITEWVGNTYNTIKDELTFFFGWTVPAFFANLKAIRDNIYSTISRIGEVYTIVSNWVRDAWNTITSAVSSAIGVVSTWIMQATNTITSWISGAIGSIISQVQSITSQITTSVSAWFSEQWAKMSALFSAWGENIAGFFADQRQLISGFWSDWYRQRAQDAEDLRLWMSENIVGPIGTWWDQFLNRIFDFGAWVNKFFDAVWSWLFQDIPGFSPRWQAILESIFNWFATWLYEFPRWFFADVPERIAYGLQESFKWVTDALHPIIEDFNNAVLSFARSIGPLSPEQAVTNFSSIAKVGIGALAGLAGMTVAGELLHPLKRIGLGNLAAVIYDMTNYKVITGAFVGAMSFSMLQTPLRYYFNNLFRPRLLSERDFTELMSRRAFTEPEALQNPPLVASVEALTGGDGEGFERSLIGYYGFPDQYHGLYKELANARIGYFALAGIARTGFYERNWFIEALHRTGYSETAVKQLLIMYEKMVDEAVQGAMSGAAIRRFKEGFTTEEQFQGEMFLLGYSEKQFAKYLAAARLDYATDYTSDLIAAYRDAVRKGNLTIDEYRQALLSLALVPERVEGYVIREVARIRPKERLTPVGPPAPFYETDQGRVQLDTLRRQRRKLLISRDEEIAGLITLGMEPGYATAIASNDDVRLAEKGEEE